GNGAAEVTSGGGQPKYFSTSGFESARRNTTRLRRSQHQSESQQYRCSGRVGSHCSGFKLKAIRSNCGRNMKYCAQERMLCAHQWLKQVKPDGSQEEFATYYDVLSVELKARYKDETTRLVASGTWMNGTAETVGKIAALDMHNAKMN
ncbi:hypothetical protein OG21DRAFT_1527858, partial [Imleria badia]